jgi:hypothetical protein
VNSNLAQLLGLLLVLRQPQQAAGIEHILDWEAGTVLSTLSCVHFLVDLDVYDEGYIDIRRGRPRDWLMVRAQPGRYHMDVLQFERHETFLVHQCFSVIPRYLCRAWRSKSSMLYFHSILRYILHSDEPYRYSDYDFNIYILHHLSTHYFASESCLNKQMIVNDLQSFEISFWANLDGNHQSHVYMLDGIRAVAHLIEVVISATPFTSH